MADVKVSAGVLFRVLATDASLKTFSISNLKGKDSDFGLLAASNDSDVVDFQLRFSIDKSYLSKTDFTLEDNNNRIVNLAHLPFARDADGANDGINLLTKTLDIKLEQDKQTDPVVMTIKIILPEAKVGGAPVKVGGASTKVGGAAVLL